MNLKTLTRNIFLPSLGLALLAAGAAAQRSHDMAVARNLQIFNAIVQELENNYVDTIRAEESFRQAIGAFLSEVDPYTVYIPVDDQEDFSTMTTGQYGGIGSIILERDGSTYISGPYADSPATKAGLKAGDKIIRIDGKDVAGKPSTEITKLLKGTPGTSLRVTVARPYVGADSILSFDIEREKVQLPSVPYWGVLPGGVGYIRLSSFMDKSPQEVRTALEAFKENPEVKSVVLDIRSNGGGLLESAIDIVGFFVPKGTEVVRTRGRDKNSERIYATTSKPILPDIPLAVLINGGSASASEIVSGAIQDLDRGILIGERSFGKGLVQGTRRLPYDGMLKITTAKYYIPSGRLIQALDYSHRNPDGTVARTPDSLTNKYNTRHGRTVRDGGGITPDVSVTLPNSSALLYNLVRQNWIFDYANKYAATHSSIPAPEDFEVTDEIYSDFKNFIDTTKFRYQHVTEEALKQMTQITEEEGYMNPAVKAQLDSLKVLLAHDLHFDLDAKRPEIAQYLGSEIVNRYYYMGGETRFMLKDDEVLDTARNILNDPPRLASLLNTSAKKSAVTADKAKKGTPKSKGKKKGKR